MKKKNKILAFAKGLGILMLLVCSMLSACSDDVEMSFTRPSVEEKDDCNIASFTLKQGEFPIPEETEAVIIALIGNDGSSQCYSAEVEKENGDTRFHMSVPASWDLPDGKYVMTMRREDGKCIPGRLLARFEAGHLSEVKIILPSYMLDGEGTEDNPYLINNDDDFSMFLINLADDKDVYGAGLRFLQTADVVAPNQSGLIPGRGYWGAPFAGFYDGGGHSVKSLYYHGSGNETSDSGIGLFNRLIGTAAVENLNIEGVSMSGLYKNCGIVAGEVAGNVLLSVITVGGHIEDGYSMGGLVGNLVSGTLTVRDARLKMNVKGTSDLGGVVGRVSEGASLLVDGVTTPDTQFSISGLHSVGGIIGRSLGTAHISNASLDHKISSEDNDISIIYGDGNGVGGIIGSLPAEALEHTLKSCYVKCPVGSAANNVGGMVGQFFSSNKLELDDCRMYSVARAKECVGGFIGKADFPTDGAGVMITGENMASRIVADDADAEIKGTKDVGGIVGYWKGKLTMESQMRVNLPVSGDNEVGGAFGAIHDSTLDTDKIKFGNSSSSSNTTMRVKGDTRTGGLAGYIYHSTLKSINKFDFSEGGGKVAVPRASDFIADYNGVVAGNLDTGGLVGYAVDSKIQHVSCSASVSGSKNVGGIVGNLLETKKFTNLEDCTFTGTLSCSSAENVGGIVGYYESKYEGVVHDCVNYSEVNGGVNTGGIIGCLGKGDPVDPKILPQMELKWCVNTGNVYGKINIGGVVGLHKVVGDPDKIQAMDPNVLISYCMNNGRITGDGNSTGSCGIGGIIGFSGPFIGVMYCANHGDVKGCGPFHGIGGIAGSLGMDPTLFMTLYRNLDVYECCNSGTINADNADSRVGGILGYQEEGEKSDVYNCHNMGDIPCKQKSDTGGIVGYVDHLTNVYKCVNEGQISHGNAMIGTHKSGSSFDHSDLYFLEGTGKNWPNAESVPISLFTWKSSFMGLDFDKVWTIEMNYYGPELANNPWRSTLFAK